MMGHVLPAPAPFAIPSLAIAGKSALSLSSLNKGETKGGRTKQLYEEKYSEKVFVEKLTKILESRLNETN